MNLLDSRACMRIASINCSRRRRIDFTSSAENPSVIKSWRNCRWKANLITFSALSCSSEWTVFFTFSKAWTMRVEKKRKTFCADIMYRKIDTISHFHFHSTSPPISPHHRENESSSKRRWSRVNGLTIYMLLLPATLSEHQEMRKHDGNSEVLGGVGESCKDWEKNEIHFGVFCSTADQNNQFWSGMLLWLSAMCARLVYHHAPHLSVTEKNL